MCIRDSIQVRSLECTGCMTCVASCASEGALQFLSLIHIFPSTELKSLFDFEAPKPTPGPNDLLVAVRAVSVNPVDTKIRMRAQGTEACLLYTSRCV